MKKGIVYSVVGPTASGKSGLALDLAKRLDGIVINADSMQVYDALSIITARPSLFDMKDVPHRLYGVIKDPNEAYSVAKWREAAVQEIERAFHKGKTPILVGGTGLYIKALLEGLTEIPETTPQIRETLRKQALTQEGRSNLYLDLQQQDPVAAERLKPNDIHRIIRALEIVMTTGKPLHEWQQIPATPLPYETKTILLNPSREDVVKRSESRLKKMFKEGAVDEVRELLSLGIQEDCPLKKAVGVREIEGYLKGDLTLESALEKSCIATRQYIKRQQTWFKGQLTPDIIFNECYDSLDFQTILKDL